MKTYLFPCLSLLLLLSCNKKTETPTPIDDNPTACFTSDKTYVSPIKTVNFTNCSQNYDRVEWNFGDGGTSTISDPSYRFIFPGTYDVRLKTFKGVNWKDQTKKIVAADTLKVHYDFKWSQAVVKTGEIMYTKLYWRKKNTTNYTLFASGSFQSTAGGPSNSYFPVVPQDETYQVKLVLKYYKYNGGMIPDLLSGMDSLETADIHTMNGPVLAQKTTALNVATVDHTISLSYH